MAMTRAQKIRAQYQEELREMLRAKGLETQVFNSIEEMLQPDIDQTRLQALKAANDTRLKLIAKYMPDMKHMELEGGENPLEIAGKIEVSVNGVRSTQD